jgi:hypothetical protein
MLAMRPDQSLSLPIHLATMTNLGNRDNPMNIVDRVNHPIIALANAIVLLAGQFLMPSRTGSMCQTANTVSITPEVGLRKSAQLSLR